jgi:hypothetical protein
MIILRRTVVTLLGLATLPIAAGFLGSPATAQTSKTVGFSGQPLITTSTLITVGPGETFQAGGVQVPPCPRYTSFLATAVQAAPYLATFANVASPPKWSVSVDVFQLYPNGSFSPHLTAFADGNEQVSTSIPGGQPIYTDEDSNVAVRLLGSPATVNTPFAVHVTGYCGVPFVAPA